MAKSSSSAEEEARANDAACVKRRGTVSTSKKNVEQLQARRRLLLPRPANDLPMEIIWTWRPFMPR